MKRPNIHPACRIGRGFVLLEVLVALLIFAIGVLGVVGLQASMTKAQTSTKMRGDAAYLAQELFGTMWADTTNIAQYSDSGCAGNANCNAIKTRLAAELPGGTISFSAPSSGLIEITINWNVPGEGAHKFVAATAVRR